MQKISMYGKLRLLNGVRYMYETVYIVTFDTCTFILQTEYLPLKILKNISFLHSSRILIFHILHFSFFLFSVFFSSYISATIYGEGNGRKTPSGKVGYTYHLNVK